MRWQRLVRATGAGSHCQPLLGWVTGMIYKHICTTEDSDGIDFTLSLTQSTSYSPQKPPVSQNMPVPSGTSIPHAEDASLASGNSVSG